MTIYVQQGPAVGQPMSPFFGAQNGLGATPVIQQPTTAPTAGGMQATGVQMSVLEACSRGLIPRNAQLATIAGQAVSAGISALQGDGVTLDEAFTSGNGAQVFVDGIANANDSLSTGPTPFNNESLVSAPLSGATTTANVTLLTGVFQG